MQAISSHSDACDRRARGEVVASSGDTSRISRNAAREHGRAVKTKDVTASARSKEVDDTDNLLFGGETSLEVGQIYRGARTNLIRDFMAWHEKTYPDHTVLSTPYKKANGLLNGYFKCKDKHTGVCQFRVIFDRLPDNSGFEITMVRKFGRPRRCGLTPPLHVIFASAVRFRAFPSLQETLQNFEKSQEAERSPQEPILLPSQAQKNLFLRFQRGPQQRRRSGIRFIAQRQRQDVK